MGTGKTHRKVSDIWKLQGPREVPESDKEHSLAYCSPKNQQLGVISVPHVA